MEDESGLELSLGLGCGISAGKSKGRSGSSSDNRTDDGDRGNKLEDDFKKFLYSSTQKQDSGTGSQSSAKSQEKFLVDLSKSNANADASANISNMMLWVSSGNRPTETEEEKRPEVGRKRKMISDEINNEKKHEKDAQYPDLPDKKISHISVTTDDGSTAENEDVADSEVEGSTSRLFSNNDDGSKQFVGVSGPSEIQKEVRGFSNSNVAELERQKRHNSSTLNEFKQGNFNFGVPFPVQPINIANMPYSFAAKESNSLDVSSNSGNQLSGMMQVMPSLNAEQQKGTQSINPPNLPMTFGYSPVQLPTLDKENPWGFVPHVQQIHPSSLGRGQPNSEKHNDGLKIPQAAQLMARNLSDATHYNGRKLEHAINDGKQHITEEGTSLQAENGVKGSNMDPRVNDAPECSAAESLLLDFSAIRAGMAAAVKFGGCGSFPNLPWVSTTGPNGRTISGVTYRYSADQIKIVCACHGSHMAPDEFVRHASEENVESESETNIATVPSTNPATSARS
ncbi:hypothetical protein K2173_016285 [Erythroxylum novogranatense]|uniref:Ninja-family protein n=1 Tax=Erythroxylum novogranatense TaxID=1862640 RepID=A0AAV8SG40_9ROSI|nr:hypothetical protein K2173_016285 [Erythroxylum novogranatense]